MTDEVKDSLPPELHAPIDEIRAAMPLLWEAADRAAHQVRGVECLLREAKVTVEARTWSGRKGGGYVPDLAWKRRATPSPNQAPAEKWSLEIVDGCDSSRPWLEASIGERLMAFDKLPELLSKLAEETKRLVPK